MSDITLYPDDDDQPAQVIQRVVASGLQLGTGLRAYAEESSARGRSSLLQLAEAVESGLPLADAVAQPKLHLPAYLRGLIEGGLRSHCLGPMLEESLHQRRLQRRMGQKVALDVAYPLVLAYFTLLLGFGMLVWLVPMFAEIFDGFGVELPGLTVLLIELSNVMVFLQSPILLGFGLSGLLLLMFFFGGRWSVWMVDWVPFFGASARYASMSEFCSLLAPLVETAVPLPEALPAVAETMQPSRLKYGVRSLADKFDGSFTLAECARVQRLPREVVHLLRWEDRGSAFGEILRSWAELFARLGAGRASAVSAILAPLMVIGIGALVGMIVIALFMPLIRLLNELS